VAGYPAKTQQDEIGLIRKMVEEGSARHDGEIAVLYRNNWQGSVLRTGIAADRCRLMTMHASKGLEFHTVIIAGISDAIIPDAFSDLEEERRLLYVAMTRARENLYLIYHEKAAGRVPLFARELCLAGDRGEHPV
jgi:superfamily I DNA/RNA helicase